MAARSPTSHFWRQVHLQRPAFQLRAQSTAAAAPAANENLVYKLPDGRDMGYAEFGNPNGRPILFFHGYPSSRLEGRPAHNLAHSHGIRLLYPERPGFGLSTPHPERTILSWADDVRSFANGLNLSSFAVLGGSGGGPYALGCGHVLPRTMVTGVGLFASAPHWAAGRHHMSGSRRILEYMSNNWPGTLRLSLDAIVNSALWLAETGPGQKRLDTTLQKMADKATNNDRSKQRPAEQRRRDFLQLMLKEPFVQGAGAAVDDARLLSDQDWGFRLEDVKYDPVHIWHGAKDENAPIAMIRWMAEKLPNAVLHEFENDTHYTMFPHMASIFETLSPQPTSQKS